MIVISTPTLLSQIKKELVRKRAAGRIPTHVVVSEGEGEQLLNDPKFDFVASGPSLRESAMMMTDTRDFTLARPVYGEGNVLYRAAAIGKVEGILVYQVPNSHMPQRDNE